MGVNRNWRINLCGGEMIAAILTLWMIPPPEGTDPQIDCWYTVSYSLFHENRDTTPAYYVSVQRVLDQYGELCANDSITLKSFYFIIENDGRTFGSINSTQEWIGDGDE